jgi:hypothetical protein
MELLMIYKISPCLPAGRLTPLCPPGQRPYGPAAKEGERKGKLLPCPTYLSWENLFAPSHSSVEIC